MSTPSKEKTFTVKENTYTAKFPNNKEYVQIQNNKARLASHYDQLQFLGAEGDYATLLVDAEAHLSVICPNLMKDLAKPFGELNFEEGREIVNVYTNEIRPWYNGVLNFIFGVNKEETTTTTTVPANAG